MKDFQETATLPVALLVDGEGVSADLAPVVLAEARRFGIPVVRRVYGKTGHIDRWADEGFRPVFVRPGKNGADLLLSVEAMSLALRETFKTLIIVAADHDYTHVTDHLRELGHEIIGMGPLHAPRSFRMACTKFLHLATEPRPAVKASPSLAPRYPATKLIPMIRAALADATQEGGWCTAAWIKTGLKRKNDGFDLSDYSTETMEKTILRLKTFETKASEKGTALFRWPVPVQVQAGAAP